MIPGIETLLGSLLGGAFRLGQAIIDAREKQRDRDHEHRMTGLQGELAKAADERRMRELGIQADMAVTAQDAQMLIAAVQAQAAEAQAAGGWVSALSASVRPLVTYLLVIFYLAYKASQIIAAFRGYGAIEALRASYTEADMAILSSILAFWFVDRSLRRGRSPVSG